MLAPSDYQPHHMGDGKRFHVRPCGGKFQVYGVGLDHICECDRDEVAEMIAEALEDVANAHESADSADLIGKLIRASEATRLQRLREIGRIDDARTAPITDAADATASG